MQTYRRTPQTAEQRERYARAERRGHELLRQGRVGAFLVAVVLVVVSGRFSARYALPLLGTGFCGAFTTFSAVVVTTAELLAHDHRGTAITYLVASICGGLAAAWLGLMFGRAVVTRHRRFRDEGNGR